MCMVGESKGKVWAVFSLSGTDPEKQNKQAGLSSGLRTRYLWKSFPFQATLRRALCISQAVLLHGSPRTDPSAMTVQGRKKNPWLSEAGSNF